MRYQFPVDMTLDEVRAAVTAHNERLGATSFIEADRGDHVIFNYVVAFAESFPTPNTGDAELDRQYAILRECRGLTFCKETGRLANRKFAKFFNINEKAETQSSEIDWSHPHKIFEKLDGSMITPLHLGSLDTLGPDTIRWCTKMGMTDVAKPVEEWVKANPHYAVWSAKMIAQGYTVIFEWCSRQQKIVIDYPEDRLVLTAIRNNATGEYLSYAVMIEAAAHGIEVVRALDGSIQNIEQFMSETRDLEGAEGYVIRFDDGHMVKAKGAWYCQIHKTKDMIQREKDVIALIAHDLIDDAKAFMDDADRDRVDRYHAAYEAEIAKTVAGLEVTMAELIQQQAGDDQKVFAALVKAGNYPEMVPGILFSIKKGMNATDQVRAVIAKYVHPTAGTQTRVEQIRFLINGLRWDDYRDHTVNLSDD